MNGEKVVLNFYRNTQKFPTRFLLIPTSVFWITLLSFSHSLVVASTEITGSNDRM